MKRESHVPREGCVLQLLCAAPRCHVSKDTALETQQSLTSKSAIIFSSARAPQRFSCSQILSVFRISVQSQQLSPNLCCECSLASVSSILSQLMDPKSFTQTAAPPTARIPAIPKRVVPHTSQGQRLLHLLSQRKKALHNPTLQDEIPRGRMRTAHTSETHSLQKPLLRNKMKCFLCCGNPKIMDEENVSSSVKKVTQTRKNSAETILAQVKDRTGEAKTNETTGDSKTQSSPTERHADLALLHSPQALDSQLQHQPRQRLSASLLGYLRYCFRCFPLVACATQQGNPT
ncbi:protein FAM205A-like [Orycteropus afer afer]|uniref:Protein FAM205A-like n=1 Tax=Orycteropus afer afer TaxID=1230840 RepID=A0A8B6ZBX8_ORYAF|nr:protein FAM205A-like [Orycteropus afer afer]